MKLSRTLQGAVLCALLFIVYSEENDQKHSKRRKCRCKKYIDNLSKDIEKRFQVFENKFAHMIAHQNDINSTSLDFQNGRSDQKLNNLSVDITTYKDKLQKECQSLKQLQENIYSQEKSVDNLDKSFRSLDYVVRNLTEIVEKLEQTVRNSIERRPQTWSVQPHKPSKKRKPEIRVEPKLYPKGKTINLLLSYGNTFRYFLLLF